MTFLVIVLIHNLHSPLNENLPSRPRGYTYSLPHKLSPKSFRVLALEVHLHPMHQRLHLSLCAQSPPAAVSIKFLPRCMECRRGLAMRKLSVRLSVRLSNAWIVTKLKKDLSRFLCHAGDHSV